MARYFIHRECWNEKTYNGYEDAPYWRITFDGGIRKIGLTDNGEYWPIDNTPTHDFKYIESTLLEIIKECKLNIKLMRKEQPD